MSPKADAAEQTQNVLEMMAAGITGQKTKAAAKLTPTKGEVQPTHVLPNTTSMFPNDVPQEVVLAAVRNIRRELDNIVAALDAVEEYLGKAADAAPVDLDAVRKEREREADERVATKTELTPQAQEIADRLTELKTKAQAEVHDDNPLRLDNLDGTTSTAVTDLAAEPDGWTCPNGHDGFTVKLSRLNREYRVCAEDGCKQFERL